MSSELDKTYVLNPGVRVFKNENRILINLGDKEVSLPVETLDWELFFNLLFQEPQSQVELTHKLNCDEALIEELLLSLKNLEILTISDYSTSARQFNTVSKYGNFFFPLHSPSYREYLSHVERIPDDKNILLDNPSGSILSLMSKRLSHRNFNNTSISFSALSNLLFSTLGVTGEHRVTPSAGGLYPLSIYFISLNIESLKKGLYKYLPETNEVYLIASMKNIKINWLEMFNTTQVDYASSSILVFIFGDIHIASSRYGERAYRYLLLEAGHSAQNISLICIEEKLDHVCIGGFYDNYVSDLFKQNENSIPLYSVIIGKKSK